MCYFNYRRVGSSPNLSIHWVQIEFQFEWCSFYFCFRSGICIYTFQSFSPLYVHLLLRWMEGYLSHKLACIFPVFIALIQICVSKIQFSTGILYRKAGLSATVFSKTYFFKYFSSEGHILFLLTVHWQELVALASPRCMETRKCSLWLGSHFLTTV